MTTIHWAGTGLSAIPGLRRLIENGHDVRVYNRSQNKAAAALAGLEGRYALQPFSLDGLEKNVKPGDVIVSMLPGDFHLPLAQISLSNAAHFVSSSYISDEMRKLDLSAKQKGLCLVNEVGLDPGIDHILAHALVGEYKKSPVYDKDNAHSFYSYCGGLSKAPNDFCYKFSWSPLGVLKALMSPSISIRDAKDYHVNRPWEAVEDYHAPLPWGAQTFEVYPNRDSRPFIAQYNFCEDHSGKDWNIQHFVRGTLRLKGWRAAWADVFEQIERIDQARELELLSDELWQRYAFNAGEADRVVLCVELKAQHANKAVWHQSYLLDAYGNDQGSAMARLVSIPLSLAVEALIAKEIDPGVSASSSNPVLVKRWINSVAQIADHCTLVNHLAKQADDSRP